LDAIGEVKIPQQQTTRKQHIKWLRRSSVHQRPLLEERLNRAWQAARQATQLLRERYGVSRVRVFGSLLYPNQFHIRSDVDLAVEGLAVHDYWDALADVLFLHEDVTIDLVDPDSCSPVLWAAIEQEGVDL
jgi:predicted nucleotidyltransferase